MPQIYDMGPTALLPLRRKACWGFFRPKNATASAGFEPANLGTKDQQATLDHRLDYLSYIACHVSWELGGASRIFRVVLYDDVGVLSSVQDVDLY